jgi:large subunit ribosomal protein L17
MRHRKAGVKLNRTSSHRDAMFRNMVTSLFKHERIRTTDTKAKELCRWADRLVTLAKRGDLHARRQAMAIVREKDVVHKLFSEAPQRFGQRAGGYTRVVKLGFRPGDAAPMAMVELVQTGDGPQRKPRRKKPRRKAQPAEVAPEAPKEKVVEPTAEDEPEAESAAVEAADEADPEPTDAADPQPDPDSDSDTAKSDQ